MSQMPLLDKGRHPAIRRIALWEGRLSRGRLADVTGLSGIRISQIIREVREQTPDWFEWDTRTKSYVVTPIAYQQASSALKAGESDLSLSAYLADTNIDNDPASGIGPITIAPWSFSQVNPSVFSRIRLAIERRTQLSFEYRSMRTPEPQRLTVEPHSLVQAGRRWHMRGYCLETGDFGDFLLAHIAKLTALDEKVKSMVKDDIRWSTLVKVRIIAHPRLTPNQQDLVRSEFFDRTMARVQSCRGALLPYLIQELRLALDTTRQLPPDYQLTVENVDEVRPWLVPA